MRGVIGGSAGVAGAAAGLEAAVCAGSEAESGINSEATANTAVRGRNRIGVHRA